MHEGKSLQEVVAEVPDYLDWMLAKDFDEDLKAIVRDAKEGRFPTPPASQT